MLAEDEQQLSRALCAILEHNGYEVDAAFDGSAALDLLLTNEYDVAVLDIMMPKMDGLEVLRAARAQGMRIPVIMLTARGTVDDKVEGLDAGANDYLVKPFAAKELLARLRVLTRNDAAFDETPLQVGNTTLRRESCELCGPVGTEHLPNREFQLMQLFMESAGQYLSTARLLNCVWGADAPEDSNVVWVYLSHLRKKLTLVGANASIKNSRNQGYALVVNEDPTNCAGEGSADKAGE